MKWLNGGTISMTTMGFDHFIEIGVGYERREIRGSHNNGAGRDKLPLHNLAVHSIKINSVSLFY